MDTVFMICAAVGGTLLVCQFVLSLLGMGHHDFDHDHDVGHHEGDNEHSHEGEWWFFSDVLFCWLPP